MFILENVTNASHFRGGIFTVRPRLGGGANDEVRAGVSAACTRSPRHCTAVHRVHASLDDAPGMSPALLSVNFVPQAICY